MKVVEATEQYLVIDDVFPEDKFIALGRLMQMLDFRSVHSQKWEKVWRLSDGTPMVGDVFFSETPSENTSEVDSSRIAPTGTSIDLIFAMLKDSEEELSKLVGKHGEEYQLISARPFLYPAGAGLSWHTDNRLYTGAYTLYLHPEWNCQWGGELLVASPDCFGRRDWDDEVTVLQFKDGEPNVEDIPIGPHLRNRKENDVLQSVGLGRYILPKPNRLVVMAGGHHHKVARVDPTAGHHVRWSVAGFFWREK